MPSVEIILYQESNGKCPVLDWLESLPKKIQEKAETRIERLAELGHELRRPEADYLNNDIYELRWRFQSVNYRILYFFHHQEAVILAHGLTKEQEVPERDIALAIERKKEFEKNPLTHSYLEKD